MSKLRLSPEILLEVLKYFSRRKLADFQTISEAIRKMVVRHFRVSPCSVFDQLHINSSGFGSPTAIIYKEESAKEEDKIQCLFGLMLQLLPDYMRFKYIYLDAPYDLVKHDQLVQQIMDCRQLWSNPSKKLAISNKSQTASIAAVRSMSPLSEMEINRRCHQLLECFAVDWRWSSNNSLYAPFGSLCFTSNMSCTPNRIHLSDSMVSHPALLNCPDLSLTRIGDLKACDIVKFLHTPKPISNENSTVANEVTFSINSTNLERRAEFYHQLIQLIQTRFQSDVEPCQFRVSITETTLNRALLPDPFSVTNKKTKEVLHYSYEYPHVIFERHPAGFIRYQHNEEQESDSDGSL